mmetsp:Transcript_9944/g.41749  ORF Transcript_9944/g.41749 Transcript_9944/m.41749 type:complete len:200 (+) Transcript_9944:1049-1648(+)
MMTRQFGRRKPALRRCAFSRPPTREVRGDALELRVRRAVSGRRAATDSRVPSRAEERDVSDRSPRGPERQDSPREPREASTDGHHAGDRGLVRGQGGEGPGVGGDSVRDREHRGRHGVPRRGQRALPRGVQGGGVPPVRGGGAGGRVKEIGPQRAVRAPRFFRRRVCAGAHAPGAVRVRRGGAAVGVELPELTHVHGPR